MVYLIGETAMNHVVSHLGEVKRAVRAEADEVGGRAKARLAQHFYEGESSISVTEGDVDAFVNFEDKAVLSIEFGHWVKGKYEDPEHPKYVEGLYILTGAAGLRG